MTAGNMAAIVRWLVRDTFRQAFASGLFWVMLVITGLFVVVCLSVSVEGGPKRFTTSSTADDVELLPTGDPEAPKARGDGGVRVVRTRLTLLFGRVDLPQARDGNDSVLFLHYVLATGVSDTLGILIALVFTAGFLANFLQPNAVTVLLAKPPPRWVLLVGKYLGVLLFVMLHATVFVTLTWAALGFRTGVWDTTYLVAIPLLLVQFAAFFGFTLLLAVFFRSTVVCVLGSIACWLACTGMNLAHNVVLGEAIARQEEAARNELPGAAATPTGPIEAPRGAAFGPAVRWFVRGGYWILPKPIDFHYVIHRGLQADRFIEAPAYYSELVRAGYFDARLSMLSSILFALFMVFAAAQQFHYTDY